jgi:hypothetical protein
VVRDGFCAFHAGFGDGENGETGRKRSFLTPANMTSIPFASMSTSTVDRDETEPR